MAGSTGRRSGQSLGLVPLWLVLAAIAFAVIIYVVIDLAGGYQISPDNSVTPNGTVTGPPR
jgi:hypothetical protein